MTTTSPERRALLREWLRQLTVDPLEPTDPRYVPLEEAGRAAVDDIFSVIDLAFEPTAQLLSGPSGSGKTTELRRLKQELGAIGFTVAMVETQRFVNQSSPIDVTEFLIAIALGAGEALKPEREERSEGFVARFRRLVERLGISIDAGPVRVSADAGRVSAGVPGLSMDIDLAKEIRRSEPFVEELRRKLAFHLGGLVDEVRDFLRELAADNQRERWRSRAESS